MGKSSMWWDRCRRRGAVCVYLLWVGGKGLCCRFLDLFVSDRKKESGTGLKGLRKSNWSGIERFFAFVGCSSLHGPAPFYSRFCIILKSNSKRKGGGSLLEKIIFGLHCYRFFFTSQDFNLYLHVLIYSRLSLGSSCPMSHFQ
jgi:hypothetical protein